MSYSNIVSNSGNKSASNKNKATQKNSYGWVSRVNGVHGICKSAFGDDYSVPQAGYGQSYPQQFDTPHLTNVEAHPQSTETENSNTRYQGIANPPIMPHAPAKPMTGTAMQVGQQHMQQLGAAAAQHQMPSAGPPGMGATNYSAELNKTACSMTTKKLRKPMRKKVAIGTDSLVTAPIAQGGLAGAALRYARAKSHGDPDPGAKTVRGAGQGALGNIGFNLGALAGGGLGMLGGGLLGGGLGGMSGNPYIQQGGTALGMGLGGAAGLGLGAYHGGRFGWNALAEDEPHHKEKKHHEKKEKDEK